MNKKILGALVVLLGLVVVGVAKAAVPPACTGITFTRNLSLGSTGTDVKCLQALLNQDSATQVAASGPGSPGNETTYFGPLTKAAVIKFQEKYAADILTPLGLASGTGFVGPATRAKLNALLTTPTPPTPPTPTPPEEEEEGEEGTLSVKAAALPSGVTVYEGDSNVAVTAFTIKAKNSNIRVKRIDIALTSGSSRIYKLLTYAALYDGDNALKGITLSKDTVTDGTVRFSGLDILVPKDGSKTITLKVSAAATLSATGSVSVRIPEKGIRGVDGAGITQYAPPEGSGPLSLKPFTLATAVTPSLTLSLSDATPKSNVAIIDEEEDTEVELAKYNLKMTNAAGTVTGLEIGFDGTASSSIVEVRVYDGSTQICSDTLSSGVLSCDDLELAMAKGTTKTLTIKALIDKGVLPDTYAYVTGVTSTYEDVEGDQDKADTSASSSEIYFYHVAPIIELLSTVETSENASGTAGNETGHFTINFKVTAQGGDVWIKDTIEASSTATDTKNSIWYDQGNGTDTPEPTALLSSNATKDGWGYKVPKGTSRTFTAKLTLNNYNVEADNYRAYIKGIAWAIDKNGNTKYAWDKDTYTWLKDLITNWLYLTSN
jgi:peptidoglycan hydrolase-like protein with peptidoglycan-binding domain